MDRPELRLLHSSDWHLEQPLAGLPALSPALREVARDAAYLAAQQVVETALVEGVDALLLSGDVVDLARSGPRAIVFLQEQFERLAARGIDVFWAGGVADPPDEWPVVAELPKNVHRFPVGRVEQVDLKRDGKTIARIQGISSQDDGAVEASGFHRDANGLFTAGVAYSTNDSPGREGDRVHYMALGGRHRRATVDTEPGIAHYSGSPQGRSPREAGPSGCTLVHVREGETHTKFISTDIIRWVDESIEITASTTLEQLEDRLEERLGKLRSKSPRYRPLGHLARPRHRTAGRGVAPRRGDRQAAHATSRPGGQACAALLERRPRMRFAGGSPRGMVRPGDDSGRLPATASPIRGRPSKAAGPGEPTPHAARRRIAPPDRHGRQSRPTSRAIGTCKKTWHRSAHLARSGRRASACREQVVSCPTVVEVDTVCNEPLTVNSLPTH